MLARTVLVVVALGLSACAGPEEDAASKPDGDVADAAENPPVGEHVENPNAFDNPMSQAEFKSLMSEKFDRSHNMLKLAMWGDFVGVAKEASALDQISLQAEWVRHGSEAYAGHANRFRESLRNLIAYCEKKDGRGILDAHASVHRACLDCHVYLGETQVKD